MQTGRVAIGALTVIAALGAGTAYVMLNSPNSDPFVQCRGTTIAGGTSAIGGAFELVNASGETVTHTEVITKPSILYFGYTYCPDVCSFDVDRNGLAVDLLVKDGKDAQNIFISIDPERDTPEVIADFETYFDHTIGLTGSPEQVKAASKAYRTYFQRQDSDDEFYLINHSTQSYLVLPDFGFVDFFGRSDTPEDVAKQMSCYIEAAQLA